MLASNHDTPTSLAGQIRLNGSVGETASGGHRVRGAQRRRGPRGAPASELYHVMPRHATPRCRGPLVAHTRRSARARPVVDLKHVHTDARRKSEPVWWRHAYPSRPDTTPDTTPHAYPARPDTARWHCPSCGRAAEDRRVRHSGGGGCCRARRCGAEQALRAASDPARAGPWRAHRQHPR